MTHPSTFIVPVGVTSIRVRVLGGGSGAYNSANGKSSGGGGIAVKTPTVTPVASYAVTGKLTFVPASGDVPAYFAPDLRVKDQTWRISKPTHVIGDILRYPDPVFPLYTEWLGRVSLTVYPGSNSAGIGAPSFAPVLIDAQPNDGRIMAAPMLIGQQGSPAYPAFDPIDDEGKSLCIVGGVPTWL